MTQCCVAHHMASVIILWLNAVHPWLNGIRHQYVAKCCASCINNIIMTQFGSMICLMHQYGSVLCTMAQCYPSTAHLCASGLMQCCASGVSMAQCCASGVKYIAQCHASSINVGAHYASIWLKCWCIHASN